MSDSKAMRRYQAGIERALALFDASNEWADYIAYLSRLLKALQGPPADADVPLKSTIARHLAQCLRPSLPSGVHQKALEVYETIFSIIKSDQLGKDLPLYLPGLSHTLSFASLSTRPQFLAIYDDHILSLPVTILRPAIRALIMSLLPGIEEETSEDFERTLSTFNRLRQKFVEDQHQELFWQNLFLASITSPNRRAGVLVYLVRYLPRISSRPISGQSDETTKETADVEMAVTTPEPGLLIRCFATGLQDPQPLIQRGFLDLLVSHLPLDAHVFKGNAHTSDLDVLVDASTAVVLRRDMSFNRRLWAWYTGSESKSQTGAQERGEDGLPVSPKQGTASAQYFAQHGLASLTRGIFSMLKTTSLEPVQRARPFRIALSLMDRSEIGGPIVETLFVPLFESLQLYQATAPSQEAFDEVYRSANVFFDGIESKVVARHILALLDKHDLQLITFLTNNFNLEEEEMVKTHVPVICFVVVETIRELLPILDESDSESTMSTVTQLAQILEDLLILIPAGVLRYHLKNSSPPTSRKDDVMRMYSKTLVKSYGSNHETTTSSPSTDGFLIGATLTCLQECLSSLNASSDLLGRMLASTDQCIALADGLQFMEHDNFLPSLSEHVRKSADVHEGHRYQIVTGFTRLIATLSSRDLHHRVLKPETTCSLVPALVRNLWHFLIPSRPQYHVEAVECIWRLHVISRPLCLVESTIIGIFVHELVHPDLRETCMQRFGTLWIHSRLASKQVQGPEPDLQIAGGDDILDLLQFPLLQVIDAVEDNLATHPCAVWMRSLTSLNSLFGVVFQQMPKDMTDFASMSIALQRLGRLIALARENDTQWKAFCGKSGYRDAVFELCSSLTSNQKTINSLGVEALQIVRILIGQDGLALGDDILKMLSTRLVASYGMEAFQDSLLDTLQAAFSASNLSAQPDYLIPILLDGVSSPVIDATIDKWITLLCTIVPLLNASSLFSSLLKITSCLCKRVDTYFDNLQSSYTGELTASVNGNEPVLSSSVNPERSISNLLSGTEYVLARAHHQASLSRNEQEAGSHAPTAEVPSSRSSANDHLTVVLCIQDALKVCSRLWLWRATGKSMTTNIDPKSLHYMTSRLRTRSRRILENLIEAEPQECLETLMGLWVEKRLHGSQHNQFLELLQTLDGARPKFMMPATFNAIYNRTNPAALDRSQKSSLSVNVNAFELIAFLNDYTSALEDDLLDEIWTDCTTFLREVLSNPLPHRQILIKLLEFTAVLCRKMENTNFGEESRMRKELADLCARLFTAIFTVKPAGLDGSGGKVGDVASVFDKKRPLTRSSVQVGNALQILHDSLPDLSLVLSQSDRLTTVYVGIGANISGPLIHSKLYPQNMSAEVLALLQTMSTAPAATKAWRKDVADAFNDAKFFQNQIQLVELGWLPLIRQLAIIDKTIVPELLARLVPPAAAGLMFGVGASAARTEADKKTQSTLRRVALLLLSAEVDYFVPHLQPLLTKLEELFTATPESSPSSNSKADGYLLLRAILLAFSPSQLSGLWPLIDNELRNLCTALLEKETSKFTLAAQLQGAKLLDLLLLMKPDEFQLHEWLFVTDTVDAIYPPADHRSVALADRIVLRPSLGHSDPQSSPAGSSKKPWLCTDESRDETRIESLLASFFAHLSIRTFEDSYSLQRLDEHACRADLIHDLFME